MNTLNFPLIGIGQYHDTSSWITNESETYLEHGNVIIIAWLHSHVRGTPLGFSSIDVHTQWAFQYEYEDLFGIVYELNNSGSLIDHDYYILTEVGCSVVKECNLTQNLSRIQHESCSDINLYKSIKEDIRLLASFPCRILNFMVNYKDVKAGPNTLKRKSDNVLENQAKKQKTLPSFTAVVP